MDAIIKMDRPRNIKQLRSFLGAVNFHRDMWPRRSHVLQPLTALTDKGEFIWYPDPNNPVHTKSFEKMKAIIVADAFCSYPDHTQPFAIYTNYSDYPGGSNLTKWQTCRLLFSKAYSRTEELQHL